MGFIAILWYITVIVQSFFGYGTAYRLTKRGSDNGVALFGWMLLMQLVALIPGLGIYLWKKYRDDDDHGSGQTRQYSQHDQPGSMGKRLDENKW